MQETLKAYVKAQVEALGHLSKLTETKWDDKAVETAQKILENEALLDLVLSWLPKFATDSDFDPNTALLDGALGDLFKDVDFTTVVTIAKWLGKILGWSL